MLRHPILELRQYSTRPGRRDDLIALFDREFIETQEAVGAAIVGQFRDLDRDDRFVWLRGFETMPQRQSALERFYTGPGWKAHSHEANATMDDVSNVLLLRPASAADGFAEWGQRPAPGEVVPASRITATIYYRDRPFDQDFLERFNREIRPRLAEAGTIPLACFQTEYAENTFPALPVRVGEHVFLWFARTAIDGPDAAVPTVSRVERIRLGPTARSLLR